MSSSTLNTTEIPSLTLQEAIDMIKNRFVMQLKHPEIKNRPVCLTAHTGIGKTRIIPQITSQLTDELKDELKGKAVQHQTLHLEFTDPPDFQGQYYIDNTSGNDPVTKHARPELLPKEGFGILFIDEPNRCKKDNRQGLMSLLEDRRANQHKLGDYWMIVMAMNPTEADGVAYEVNEFDNALESRINKVIIKADPQGTISYLANKYSATHPVLRWIISNPQVIDFKGKTRTNPRGLEYLINAIATDNGGIVKDIGNVINFNTVAMEIGMEAAYVFTKFVADDEKEIISAESIVEKFDNRIAHKLKEYEAKGRTDVLTTLINNVTSVLSNKTMETLTKKNLENLCKYMDICSAESKRVFLISLYEPLRNNQDMFDKIASYLAQNCPSMKTDIVDNQGKEMTDSKDDTEK